MIVTKTPLRISFFSGGSDMPEFYQKQRGAALSVTIDKYIYVNLHKTAHLGVRLMYDKVEEFSMLEAMQHAITRESLELYNVRKEITIASVSDIIAKGSGLGSSSAFTVGLINGLEYYNDKESNPAKENLANNAFRIERELCGYPVGKQDQYAAAYGGMNLFEFEPDNTVVTKPLTYNKSVWNDLQNNLILVYSGKSRNANAILQKQASAMSDSVKFDLVKRSRDKAYVGARYIKEGKLDDFGALLHDAWLDKKSVESSITNSYFDEIYETTRKSGAIGGKLLGAGGGGFFIFYAPEKNKSKVLTKLQQYVDTTECRIYDFKFVENGSKLSVID